MPIDFLLVFVGGSLGAVCRYALSTLMKQVTSIEFPVATLLINLLGSFLLGILLSSQLSSSYELLLGTGYLGGFTTFSTFQVENITLYKKKEYRKLFIYVTVSVISCITFSLAGLTFTTYMK